jgi:hypothetical protein
MRRAILKLGACLALGAAATVVSAWIIALWIPQREYIMEGVPEGEATNWWNSHFPFDVRPIPPLRLTFPELKPDATIEEQIRYATADFGLDNAHESRFSAVTAREFGRHDEVNGEEKYYLARNVFIGWPFRALQYSRWSISRYSRNDWDNEKVIDKWSVAWKTLDARATEDAYGLIFGRRVPLCPLWPGFAINTVFFAAILWLLLAGPGWIRRRLRIMRGSCPSCGYIIAPGSTSPVCTECGKALPRLTARVEKAVV